MAFVRAARVWGWDAEGVDPDPRGSGRSEDGCANYGGGLPKLGYPVAGLREVRRILRPAGTVWIRRPNLDSRGHRIFGANWRGLEPPRHLVLFTAASLMSALSRAGFEQVHQVRAQFSSQWYFASSNRAARDEDSMCSAGSRFAVAMRSAAFSEPLLLPAKCSANAPGFILL
jgi:hypothetical protein